jgi:hypothetical protein
MIEQVNHTKKGNGNQRRCLLSADLGGPAKAKRGPGKKGRTRRAGQEGPDKRGQARGAEGKRRRRQEEAEGLGQEACSGQATTAALLGADGHQSRGDGQRPKKMRFFRNYLMPGSAASSSESGGPQGPRAFSDQSEEACLLAPKARRRPTLKARRPRKPGPLAGAGS